MEQIKHMIFQSKQCLLIQNLHVPYFGDAKKDSRAPVCQATGRPDAKEDFILSKFNELYYLSCEKDDTYRFNIRQSIRPDADQHDQPHKRSTFYDDQPQE